MGGRGELSQYDVDLNNHATVNYHAVRVTAIVKGFSFVCPRTSGDRAETQTNDLSATIAVRLVR